ncbi:hypothetical protein B0H10DRAFT_2035555 [Mycena sp. CBHHK59/15]|nr:hypothetical protein B0H10DRAFT_2035555 [Mycena sp. CBHHK59/15]
MDCIWEKPDWSENKQRVKQFREQKTTELTVLGLVRNRPGSVAGADHTVRGSSPHHTVRVLPLPIVTVVTPRPVEPRHVYPGAQLHTERGAAAEVARVWSSELSAALLRGLEKYFSDDASREKRPHGRFPKINLLISKYIRANMGIERTKKQVGSHLQHLMQSAGVKSPLDLLHSLKSVESSSNSFAGAVGAGAADAVEEPMTEATLRGWPEPTGARPSSGGTDVPGEGPVPVGASVAVASGGQSAPFGSSTICDTTFRQWPESHAEESVAKDPVGLAHATCGVAVWEGTLFGGPYSSPVPSVGDFGFMANTFVAAPEGDNLAQQIQDEADTGFNMVCGPTDRRFPLVTPVGPISEPSEFTPRCQILHSLVPVRCSLGGTHCVSNDHFSGMPSFGDDMTIPPSEVVGVHLGPADGPVPAASSDPSRDIRYDNPNAGEWTSIPCEQASPPAGDINSLENTEADVRLKQLDEDCIGDTSRNTPILDVGWAQGACLIIDIFRFLSDPGMFSMSAGFDFQTFGNTLSRSLAPSYEDECLRRFITSSEKSSSAIRGYPLDGPSGAPGWIYFAVVGDGRDRKFGKVYLRAPMTYAEMAVEFGLQGNAGAVTRSVYEHGRFSRNAQSRGLESHFRMILMYGRCRDGELVWFHWIMAANPTDILWWHHRLELALSFAVGKNQADLGRLLDYLSPFDAMLHKLPSEEDRAAYWQHHQVYFEGMALVEYSVPTEAGVEICLESYTSLLFEALWESVLHPNAYPTSQQVVLGRKFGCRMFLYSHGSFRLYAEYRRDIYLGYPCQINAFRDALEQSISQLSHEWLHKLVPNYMHPLYAVYAHQTRISMEEARRTGDPPRLPKLPC